MKDSQTEFKFNTGRWKSVAYGNGLFVAVPNQGLAMTSQDGNSWETLGANHNYHSVTFGKGLFVALVSTSGSDNWGPDNWCHSVMTSSDGTVWTMQVSPHRRWNSLTYGNNCFVAVGDQAVMTSPDGFTWTMKPSYDFWSSVTYGNGLFVAVASNQAVMTSTDGSSWTVITTTEITNPEGVITDVQNEAIGHNWHSVTYGSCFVAVSISDGAVMTSPDGTIWRSGSAEFQSSFWQSIAS